MNHRFRANYFFLRVLTLICLSLIMTAMIQGQLTAAPAPHQAYYVQYEPGRKMDAIRQVEAAGGRVDHDLSEWQVLAVSVPSTSVNKLSRSPAIAFSEPVPVYELAEERYPFGLDTVQALDVWDFDRDGVLDSGAPIGNGIKVCIIDTGVLDSHKDLALTTISGVSQIDGEAWNDTITGHGTHVAGTVAANMQGAGIAGVAPGVDLYIVKIYDRNGAWIEGQSNIAAAAASCVENGAHIISMSLKGSYSRIEKRIFSRIYDRSVLSIAAAANDGSSSGSVDEYSYPASYNSVISVAAITSAHTHASYSNENDQVELAAPGSAVMSTWPGPENGSVPFGSVIDDESSHSGSYLLNSTPGAVSGVLIDGGLCTATDMSDEWNGKIVICQRDALYFRELVSNTEGKGAVATIVIWKEPGLTAGTLAPGTSSGPAVLVAPSTGVFLKTNKLGTVITVETGDGSDPLPGPGGYQGLNGTSMAAPHVAGTAALIWGACPELDNQGLREILTKSALDLGDPGWDMSFGHGLVQAFAGWHTCQPADLGDSQRSYGQVRHTGNGELRLGSMWGMNNWQGDYPGAGHDDENDDGLIFSAIEVGRNANVTVTTTGRGNNPWIEGWFDFNRDGVFSAEERVVDGMVSLTSATDFSFSVPSSLTVVDPVNYRFRLYDKTANPPLSDVQIIMMLSTTLSGGEAEDGSVIPSMPTAVSLQEVKASYISDIWVAPVFLFISALLFTLVLLLVRWFRLSLRQDAH